MPDISEQALIDEVQTRLAREHADLEPDRVSAAVAQAYAHFEHSPVRDFIALLVERRAREALTRQSQLVAP